MSISKKAAANCLTPKPNNSFYVYLHTKENGDIFYIGKGTENRAWICNGRGAAWDNITTNEKWNVVIVCDRLDKAQALTLEEALIVRFNAGKSLTNVHKTKGAKWTNK